jgi:hypothetical protein
MGMDEIIKLYEETFSSSGDVDQFGVSQIDPSDWRSILKMINAGMSEEQIKEQLAMNTMKDRVREDVEKVEAFAPEGEQLAYITPQEAGILKLMGGSGEPEPITGVATFADPIYGGSEKDYTKKYETGQWQTQGGDYGQESRDRGRENIQRMVDEAKEDWRIQRDIKVGGTQQPILEQIRLDKLDKDAEEKGVIEDLTGITGTTDTTGTGTGTKTFDEKIEEIWTKKDEPEISKNLEELGITSKTMLSDFWNATGGKMWNFFTGKDTVDKDGDEKTDAEKNWEKYAAEKAKFTPPGIFVSVMKMLADPKAKHFTNKNYLAIMQDVFKKQGGFEGRRFENFMKEHAGVIKEGMLSYQQPGKEKITFEDLMKREYIPEAGSGLEKRLNPEKYWSEFKGGGTMGDMEDLAGLDAQANPEIARKIFEAREIMGRQKDAQDRRSGKGFRGGGADVIEEKLTEIAATTPTDPRAGAFGVGGTMPYTEDIRTAGVETDVPLGRRFAIDKAGKYRGTTGMDLSEAMKYATLGGYDQLEPFQEYLKRRREHLGEDEPRYFDEEGNVIYSTVT